jgi:hypothetical protein
MVAQSGHKPWWLYFLRWGARIAALSLFAISLKEFLRLHLWERDLPQGMIIIPPIEDVFIFYIIGLIIGFWSERIGSLVCLLGFVFVAILFPYIVLSPLIIFILLLPSILYFSSWYFHRRWVRQQLK